jgi:hypothetical protein
MLFITIGLAVVMSFSAPHKVQASVISSPGAGTFHGLDKDAPVPEPSSLALILAGALALLLPRVINAFRSLRGFSSLVRSWIFQGHNVEPLHIGHQAARTDFLN